MGMADAYRENRTTVRKIQGMKAWRVTTPYGSPMVFGDWQIAQDFAHTAAHARYDKAWANAMKAVEQKRKATEDKWHGK